MYILVIELAEFDDRC